MIDIDKLQFTYNNGFNLYIKKLDIKKGDIVSIIGPNGAGKSTLIKIISKIIKNYTGKIMIENKELSNYSYKELSRKIAIVPQEFNTTFEYDVESV
ncbi:MAG TPA: ABC transporter ATP-binding protein, partial [Defluviitoga tunisiensis]|nr:ABC transporter ATP-binding protein [Defluviitoga tunisiensis]